jgi:hypothetical protein
MESNIHVLENNIYITDNSEIRDWWVLNTQTNKVYFVKGFYGVQPHAKKIILTTDEDLIQGGIQPISNEFLQWFVKNPSCERVEVKKRYSDFTVDPFVGYQIIIPQENPDRLAIPLDCTHDIVTKYGVAECQNCGLEESKISKQLTDLEIEREDSKQETLEEAAEKLARAFDNDNYKALMDLVIDGAKFQAERMYSEEDLRKAFNQGQENVDYNDTYGWSSRLTEQDWFSQFKKQNNEI